MKKILTIAGSDSCGGAGVQADLKTFSALGTYGMSVITAITAQNTQGVFAVHDVPKDVISKQIDAIFTDIEVDAVKIGMVSKIDTIDVISEKLKEYKVKNIVLDPVMISKSGFDLIEDESKNELIEKLIPLATIITPNIFEASAIISKYKNEEYKINSVEDIIEASKILYDLGAKNVLLKGGALENEATDVLYDGKNITLLEEKKIHTKNTHGTGCTLSSAIAANLGLGYSIEESVIRAKEYITTAIEHALTIGKGVGPTNHFYTLYKKSGLL